MAEVDTSSYPKAGALPAQKSVLDQAQQYGTLQQQQQQIQSNSLGIEKQKLDLVNQRFGEMAKGFSSLIAKPDLNLDDIRRYTNTQVKLGYVPADMAATTLSELPNTQGMKPEQAAKVLKGALEQHLAHAQTMVEALNTQFGQNATQNNGATTYQGVTASPLHGGGFTPSTQVNQQLPPTLPITGANNAPGVIGPAGPAGVSPAGSVPMPAPRPQGALPVSPNAAPAPTTSGPSGPTVNNGSEFNNRFSAAFPNAIQTGPAPGVAEAQQAVGTESGKDYATDLKRANNYSQDIYPMQRVLDIVHEEGPKAFGPGTDSLNNLKSILVTWLPGVDQKTIDGVSNFEQAKKYLVQAARASGSTGTNDQLAAAFEANPNTKMSGATIENVIKSNIALRRVQNALPLMFGKTGLPESDYSKWVSKNQNVLDPRAFGYDMMDEDAQKKLLDSFTEKEGDSKEMKAAKAQAYTKFGKSLKFAHDANLIGQ